MKTAQHPILTPLAAHAFALAVAMLSGAALAQGTPPAPAAAAAAPAAPAAPLPKHTCTSPGDHPGRLASDNTLKTWTRAANAYLDCLKKFVASEQAIAKPMIDASKPHIEAANAAVEEHNAAAKSFKDQQDALTQ